MKTDDPTLDFIPSDPAELRRAVTHMAAYINVADWQFRRKRIGTSAITDASILVQGSHGEGTGGHDSFS